MAGKNGSPRVFYGTEPPGKGWLSAGGGKWINHQKEGDDAPLRVAVIGGGPGGLFTTYILNQRLPEADIVVFEGSDRLGGKIRTDTFSDGTPFEAGVAELYEYLGPGGADPLRSLIEDDLHLPTVDMAGGCVVLHGEVIRDYKEFKSVHGKDAHRRLMDFYALCSELMPLEKYAKRWQPDNSHEWAGKTFRQCIHETIPDDSIVRQYIETAVHSDLATESHTCNGLNGIKNCLLDNDRYMQLYHVLGGIGRVAEALEATIEAEVRLETRVTEIDVDVDGNYLVSYQEEGVDYDEEFDAIFVCLPNHWLGQIKWHDPILAEAIHSVIAHYDLPAHYLRISLNFASKWWEKFQIPGDFWMMDIGGGLCCYDESTRWRSTRGHVLSFLLAGQDALLCCSSNQDETCIVDRLLDNLPPDWREEAREALVECQVDRYVGSVNAQPGGWPVEDLRGEHQPEPLKHPLLYLVGDYMFDSTLNAALISAYTAVDCCLEELGVKAKFGTQAIKQLSGKDL